MIESSSLEALTDDGARDRSLRPLLIGVLLLIVVSGTVDLVLDAPDSWRSIHVIYEIVLIVGALATTALLWLRWIRAERSLSTTRRALHEHQAERDAWRASAERALLGFGAAIDDQLSRWGLTATSVPPLSRRGKTGEAKSIPGRRRCRGTRRTA